MARMIGKSCPYGPGGRDCSCCGDAPSARKMARRIAKRRERNTWKREVSMA
jgi:hypothetical protein